MMGHNQTKFNLASMQFNSYRNIVLSVLVRVHKRRVCACIYMQGFLQVCTVNDEVCAAGSVLLLLLFLAR